MNIEPIKKLCVKYFGKFVDKHKDSFKPIKKYFEYSGIDMFFRTYLALMLGITVLCLKLSIVFSIILFLIFRNPLWFLILLFPIGTFSLFYFYPYLKSSQRKNSIESNLPFAINHMYAISASGAPPITMFKLLSNLTEYGEISKEAKKIVRNIEVFGMDEITALKQVASKTPSKKFKEILDGISYSIRRGGSLKLFLREKSKSALFDYTINRQKYNQTLAIYADIYTAILVAAPLIFVVILSILNVLGGTIMGMPIIQFTRMILFIVIPLLNILFLLFIHTTQPKV